MKRGVGSDHEPPSGANSKAPVLSLASDLPSKNATATIDAKTAISDSDPEYRGQDLPDDLKTLVERWLRIHPQAALPCTFPVSTWDNVFQNPKGEAYNFYHSNGDRLNIRICNLDKIANREENTSPSCR